MVRFDLIGFLLGDQLLVGKSLRELHLKFKAPIDEDRDTPVARYDMRIMASHPKDREFYVLFDIDPSQNLT